MTNCGRCFSLKNKIVRGIYKVFSPNGIEDHVCDECFNELTSSIIFINEDQENENVY